MTKEKLEQALKKLGSTTKYGWNAYSNVAYTIVETILTEWVESDDSYETQLDEFVHQELENSLIFYKDLYDYLEQRNVWDITDAVREGFGDNLGDIAYYFLQEEVYSLLSELDIY